MQLGHYHGPGPASSLSARMILHSSSIHVKIVYVKASLLGVVYPIHPSPLSNPNANKFDRKSGYPKICFDFPVKFEIFRQMTTRKNSLVWCIQSILTRYLTTKTSI